MSRQARFHDLNQCTGWRYAVGCTMCDWQTATTAPFDRDLELAVIDRTGTHALVFPCRRIVGGWMKAETRERLEVHPTHWREWQVAD